MGSDTRRIPVGPGSLSTGAAKIDDPIEIRKYFISASETGARADIALPQMGRRFVSKIGLDWKPGEPLSFEIPTLVEKFELPPEGTPIECNIILFLKGQILICVRSEAVTIDKNVLFLNTPWTVFKIQRRKEARYEIPSAYEFYVKIDSLEGSRFQVSKRLLDVSTTGLALLAATQREAGLYKKGLIMKNIHFQIEGDLIKIDAQVCNIVPIHNMARNGVNGFKIGLKILRIGKEDGLTLSSWVARKLSISYTV